MREKVRQHDGDQWHRADDDGRQAAIDGELSLRHQ